EVAALEPNGPPGKMSLPRMYQQTFSYDDALDDPTPPPSVMGSIPWKPVIPECKYQHLADGACGGGGRTGRCILPGMSLSSAIDSMDKVPVGKAKATHVIMNSLITKQIQESIQCSEPQAGLRDAGSTPYKGLTTEETKYLLVAEALHILRLNLHSGEMTKAEKQAASAQSAPSSTPHSPPKHRPRGRFTSGSSIALPGPNLSTMDSGSRDKNRNPSDKWSLFGPRTSFTTQAYQGAQKPSPVEMIQAQDTAVTEDPATFKSPKMVVSVVMKKQPPGTSNLKPADLNVLTSIGF
uniref:Putative monooxygenase p33MONOX n=1 Tax=Otolemur garnettii TaxID=30611 RepID=H0XJQ8_OTOGA